MMTLCLVWAGTLCQVLRIRGGKGAMVLTGYFRGAETSTQSATQRFLVMSLATWTPPLQLVIPFRQVHFF